jgi:hypothetical protein
MAATITVRYYVNERKDGRSGYPLRVVAVNAIDMPEEIFVFQRQVPASTQPPNPDHDFFISVADPNGLEEYPVEPPTKVEEQPYYRRSEVELVFRSQAELEDAKSLIDTSVRVLVLALRSRDDMDEMEEITYDG